jgi:hypothetical protein
VRQNNPCRPWPATRKRSWLFTRRCSEPGRAGLWRAILTHVRLGGNAGRARAFRWWLPKPPQLVSPQILATAGRAYKAGVKIAFGTDAAFYPHGQNAHEFELMIQAGMLAPNSQHSEVSIGTIGIGE